MGKVSAFLKRKNVLFSAKRYGIDAMGAMAQGLFCTLLVGTILNTLGQQFGIGFLTRVIVTVGNGEGAVGYTISQALTSGFQRGMFSNEAGMGSSPNAAAAAASWPPHPAAQGIVQMIGVFIDTIVICTASAIIVMLAPRPDNEYTLNGIQDLQHAMSVLVGGWGAGFIALIVLLFAFSSIVANYVYAENNLVFLRLDKPRYIWGLRILTVLMVLLGTMVSLPVVWQSADIIMALMAMTNLTAILLLSPTVRIIASDYLRQRRLGIQPTFDATRYPDIDQQLAPGAWNELPRE